MEWLLRVEYFDKPVKDLNYDEAALLAKLYQKHQASMTLISTMILLSLEET